MALARKREWYFEHKFFRTAALAILTAGLFPLLEASRRFDRWRRLEWLLLADYSRWLAGRVRDENLRPLIRLADDGLADKSLLPVARLIAWIGAACVAVAVWRMNLAGLFLGTGQLSLHLVPIAGWVVCLMLAAGMLMADVLRQRAATRRWIQHLSATLIAHEHRPVTPRRSSEMLGWFVPSILMGVPFFWTLPALFAIGVSNAYVRSTRPVRMQLIERMLEINDNSGLPMEYDVIEPKPAELLAMLAG